MMIHQYPNPLHLWHTSCFITCISRNDFNGIPEEAGSMNKTETPQKTPSPTIFDEMFSPEKTPRPAYEVFQRWMDKVDISILHHKQAEAEALFKRLGITFSLYGAEQSGERQIPFDIIPRIFSRSEWRILSNGSCQRIRAINAFLYDIYHGREIIRAGIIPESQIMGNSLYRKELENVTPPGGVYVHIAGVDIVRVSPHEFYVLEDNLRTPSGASYMLENRSMMMRLFPEVFDLMNIAPVDHYPQTLLHTLQELLRSQHGNQSPCSVLLTPGVYNSAYFEHAFLAEQMGVELVEGQDLFVSNDKVYMRTTQGSQQVDIIYRRIDDDFLDPKYFRKDSMIGVAGLLDAYRAGNILLANALGTGVADDKSTYTFVPKMIDFYLGEKPLLKNVETYCLSNHEDLQYVLDHISELVIKEVGGSGGYGMLVGPASSKKEIEDYRKRILADPANFIAQPTLSLSTCPTFVNSGIVPRHVDLRPFVLSGTGVSMIPGGLTRVALKEGSLVVNSSQGGGTKDTWILEEE